MRARALLIAGIAGLVLLGCSPDSSTPAPVGTPTSKRSGSLTGQDGHLHDEHAERRVTLEVGHCFVEPIRVAGQMWVTRRTYLGYGGGVPRRFMTKGSFVITRRSEAIFLADGGAHVRFKVAPTPLPTRGCR